MSAADSSELRWVSPGEAATAAGVATKTVWDWCRRRAVMARRLPGAKGKRGRWRVALVQGLPLAL